MNNWRSMLFTASVSAAAGWFSNYIDWSNANAPAWVQGIGSVVAIFAAVAIANIQNAREIERRNKEEQNARASRLLSACMHGLHVRKILTEFISEIQLGRYNDGFREMQRVRFAEALTGFHSITFDSITPEDARLITATIIILSEVFAATGSAVHINSDTAVNVKNIMEKTSSDLMFNLTALDTSYKRITGRSTLD